MKKLVGLMLTLLLALSSFGVTTKAYEFIDWQAGEKYGSIQKVDDNILKFFGDAKIDEHQRYVGPFTKANMKSFEKNKVIDMEVHVKVDLDVMKAGELFKVTTALNDSEGEYVTELRMAFVKTDKGTVKVRPDIKLTNHFEYEITQSGIYTLRWEYVKGTNAVMGRFILKNKDVELLKGTVPNMDEIGGKKPAIEKAVVGRYLWFNDIKVKDGLNIYKNLPNGSYVPPAVNENTTLDNTKIQDAILNAEESAKVELVVSDNVSEVKLPKEALAAVKDSGKELAVEMKDTSGKAQYTWYFSDSIEKDINLVLNQTETKDIEAVKDVEGVVLDFNHSGELPQGTKVKVNVSKKFASGDKVKVSYLNEKTNQLEETKEYVVDTNGDLMIGLVHCSKYVVEKVESLVKPGTPEAKPDPKPNLPVKPDTSVKPDTTVVKKAPATSDTTNTGALLVLLTMSGFAVYSLTRRFKKVSD